MARTPEEIHALLGTDPNWRTRQGEQPAAPAAPAAPSASNQHSQRISEIHEQLGTDPDWRQRGVAEERDYDTGIGYAFMRGFERLRALPDVAQGDYEELAGHYGAMDKWRMSDEDMARLEEIRETEGFWAKTGQLLMEPRLVLQTVAESLPMMAAPIAGALGGGLAGGAATGGSPIGAAGGAMVGGGLGSYFTEYYNSVGEYFSEQGVDLTNPTQLKAAFADDVIMDGARDHAMKRGIPIAVFDALSMGLAGRIAKPISATVGKVTGGRRIGAGVTAELGMQAGFGMAGEAGAQLASEGEITDELDVIMEGLAELAPGVVEAGVSNYVDRKAEARRAGIEDPSTSPLAALDQPEPETERPIAATDIDPQTGEVVTRTGDVEQDALDVALEDGLAGLQMEIEGAAIAKEVAAEGAARAVERQGSRNMQMIEMEQQRDEQLGKQGRLEEARKQEEIEQAYRDRELADIEGPEAATGEMVTPAGVPVEGEPVDVAGAQPATEGQILPEGVNPVGGRPLTTSLGEALRGAGIAPPDDEGPSGGAGAPVRGPDATAAEARAVGTLEAEEEARAEREAIQGEPGPMVGPEEADIPFPDLEAPAAEKPAKPDVPKPTKRPNYARDPFLLTRAKESTKNRLSMEKFEAEGFDLADMREPKYGKTPAFSRHPEAMGPDDVAEFLNEQNYPNPFDNGSVGTWDANQALEAIQDEMAGVSEILTSEAIGNRAEIAEYERQLDEAERQAETPVRQRGQGDMFGAPSETAQAVADQERKRAEKEKAAPEADTGALDDLFTAPQTQEQEQAQTDLDTETKRMAKEEAGIPEGLKLRDKKPSEIREMEEELDYNISQFEREGEVTGWDRNAILLGVNQLRLYESSKAEELALKASGVLNEDLMPGAAEPELTPAATEPEARVEQLHEKWRTTIDEKDPNPVEIKEANKLIDELVASPYTDGDEVFRLAVEQDWWENWAADDKWVKEITGQTKGRHPVPIVVKSSHERYKKSRKSNKWGSVGGLDKVSAQGVSVDISQLSWTVPYDTLTFAEPEMQARLDRLIDVYNKTHDKPVAGTPSQVAVTEDKSGGMRTKNAYFLGFNETLTRASKGEEFQAAGSPSHTIEIESAQDGTIEVNLYRIEGVQNVLLESTEIAHYEHMTDRFLEASVAASEAKMQVDELPRVGPPISMLTEDGKYVAVKGDTFPPPKNRRVLDEAKKDKMKPDNDASAWSMRKKGSKLEFGGILDARAAVADWKAEAKRIGETGVNKNRVIISLFDATGTWSQPYVDAGYTVLRYDSARGDDIHTKDWFLEIEAIKEKGYEIAGVMAAPPCTSFASAGAQWWGAQHDSPSKDWVRKKYGELAATHYDRPIDYAEAIMTDVVAIVDLANPTDFHAMENPSGRLRKMLKEGEWNQDIGLPSISFDPWHFGDPYTKRTHLWGEMNTDLPIATVAPTEGSKMHKMHSGAEKIGGERSATPEGFSYAFFMANHRTEPPTPAAAPAPTEAPVPSEADIEAVEAETVIPTEAQIEAGNYKTPPLKLPGDITFRMETAEGVKRKGYKQAHPYGYVEGTKAADGDPLDMFVNKKMAEDWTGDVYIVDQQFSGVGGFDEHKVMFGFNNMIDARRGYKASYGKDWKGAGPVTKMSLEEFKTWLAEPGALKKPAAMSTVTEAGRKARKKSGKDLRYSAGRDAAGAPNQAWVAKVLGPTTEKGDPIVGDIVDTMPMNVAVSELLKLQEQREGAPAAPAKPSHEAIAAAIKPVENSLPGAPVTLLHNYKQAPAPVVKTMQEQGMTQVKAVFDPQTNAIYMFSDQIQSIDEGIRTSLHEKAHRGLRKAFGERLNPLLDDVFKNANETRQDNMRTIAEKYGLDPTVQEDQRVIAEELLAHMAEHDVSDGMVNRAVAFIRKLLRDLGVTIEFTDNDIRALIRESQGAVSRVDRTAGVTIEEEVTVEGSEEVYIVEHDADVALTGISQRIEICKKLRACL
jgi:hypothetical protein